MVDGNDLSYISLDIYTLEMVLFREFSDFYHSGYDAICGYCNSYNRDLDKLSFEVVCNHRDSLISRSISLFGILDRSKGSDYEPADAGFSFSMVIHPCLNNHDKLCHLGTNMPYVVVCASLPEVEQPIINHCRKDASPGYLSFRSWHHYRSNVGKCVVGQILGVGS